jgi:hypothetical protein
MAMKRTVVVAAGVSAALLSASAAIAAANGIFGHPQADRIGTFQTIEERLEPVADAAQADTDASRTTAAAAPTAPERSNTATAAQESSAPASGREVHDAATSRDLVPAPATTASPTDATVPGNDQFEGEHETDEHEDEAENPDEHEDEHDVEHPGREDDD